MDKPEAIKSRIGDMALYKEGRIFTMVKILGADITPDRFFIDMEDLRLPGFLWLKKGPTFNVGAIWDVFSCGKTNWHASWVNWTFFFDHKLIERAMLVAKQIESLDKDKRWLALHEVVLAWRSEHSR